MSFRKSTEKTSHPAKQQIESRQLDNEGNDIDAVVEQIPFLFIELGEILLNIRIYRKLRAMNKK